MKWLLSLILIGLSTSAYAQNEVTTDFDHNFAHAHDQGLYVRLGVDVLYAQTLIMPPPVGRDEDRQTGMYGQFQMHAGGYLVPKLALHASVFTTLGLTRGVLSGGPGLTYYFDELDHTMISIMAGPSTLYADDFEPFEQFALAAQVQLGTGWWVGDHQSILVLLSVGGTHINIDGDAIGYAAVYGGIGVQFVFN